MEIGLIVDSKFIEAVEELDRGFNFYVTIKGSDEPLLKAQRDEHQFFLNKHIKTIFEIVDQAKSAMLRDGKYTIELSMDYQHSELRCECFPS